MSLDVIAALCFGIVIGWATYRTLRRTGEVVALSSIASVTGAVGGGAISAAFGDAQLFAWYAIGLSIGFFLYLGFGNTVLRETPWLGEEGGGRSVLPDILGGLLRSAPTWGGGLGNIVVFGRDRLKEGPAPRDLVDTLERVRESAPPEPRYADAHLFDAEAAEEFGRASSLRTGALVTLRLSIGKLSAGSLVRNAIAFPADKVPPDVDLDVMVSSTDFTVTPMDIRVKLTGQAEVAHGSFFLPGNGEAARAPDGSEFLWFVLTAPDKPMRARCRIAYYYKSVLVQSQLLQAAVGQEGGIVVDTDFTLSSQLTNLASLPDKPRISILTNSNGDGTHQIILRKPGTQPDPQAQGRTFAVNELTIGSTVKALRSALLRDPPATPQRSVAQLRADLTELAPRGFDLWAQVPGQHPHMFQPVIDDPGGYVVQVSRPTSSGFVFPWALIYDIPLTPDTPERPAKRTFCKLVTDWDGRSPLVQGSPRACPHEDTHDADVLCPFGFWGFRYSIDQLSSTDGNDTAPEIIAPDRWDFVVGETQYGLDDKSALAAHIQRLSATLRARFPGANLREGKDKKSIQALLGQDLPFVYFYCHGEKSSSADPNVRLGVGNQESISAAEFRGWIQLWLTKKRIVWNKTRPLVFINACSSLEIYPETLISFVDAFVGSARAAGVIGTEIQVHQYMAMQVAENFFNRLLEAQNGGAQRQTVDAALRGIRFDYLAKGNLLGLMYTPYCWSELRLVDAKP